MQCNIDARGKAYRLRMGIATLRLAAIIGILIFLDVLESTTWWYILGAVTFGGAFTIFEARAGWCIIRASGFKTPF